MATDEVVLHGTIRLDSKIRSLNVHFHDSFWREQTLAARKLFLSLIRIDFAVAVSSRAVRISSRAVRVLPALSLRRVRPSYGTFSLMVFQGNCARPYGSYDKSYHVSSYVFVLRCRSSTSRKVYISLETLLRFLQLSDRAYASRARCIDLFLLLVILAPHDSNGVFTRKSGDCLACCIQIFQKRLLL